MDTTARPTPEVITAGEFQDALDRYDQLIEAVSESKGAKTGQKTLAELDRYRYTDCPATFSLAKGRRAMNLSDVKTLVEWKLKHGKFRPTLMKLVSSNDEAFVQDTIKTAVERYAKVSDTPAALDTLTKLKGIGPATASLLLAVHDPERVVFFADEAFYWLCSGGKNESLKYNAKEYKMLEERARALTTRLGVRAVDVEKVAYVLLNGDRLGAPVKEKEKSATGREAGDDSTEKKRAAKKPPPGKEIKAATVKRKQDTIADEAPPLRRSKRGKLA